MSLGKEKARLEKILVTIAPVEVYNEQNAEIVNEVNLEFAIVLRLLYKRHPNIFGNLFKYDLSEIKSNKKFTKDSFSDEARQNNFVVYKDSIVYATEKALEYINDYL
ncbi:MAG: hypothetical protein MUP99_11640 [Pedobacter sp.]|nr:hypothetical protein [Pedobacter sp.]